MSGYLGDVVCHDRAAVSCIELRRHPRRQCLMPDERVAPHLEMIGRAEVDESVCGGKVVYPGLAAQRTPLHIHFRSGDAALRQEQLLILRGLHAILQRQAGAEQQTFLPGQLLQRAGCRLGLCSGWNHCAKPRLPRAAMKSLRWISTPRIN